MLTPDSPFGPGCAVRAVTSAITTPDVAERLARQPQDVLLVDHLQLDLVAQHVLRAHRGATGRRDHPPAVRSAGSVETAAAEHLPDPGVRAPGRYAVRVVVVVADAQDVAQLVREDGHARALGLRGRTAAGVRPDRRTGGPGGPVDVPGVRPVRQVRVRRAEVVADVLLGRELHHPELLPGGRLVLAGAQEEDEVEPGRYLGTRRRRPRRRGRRCGCSCCSCRRPGRRCRPGTPSRTRATCRASGTGRTTVRSTPYRPPESSIQYSWMVCPRFSVPGVLRKSGRTRRPGPAVRRSPRRSGCRTGSSPSAG